MDSAHLFMAKSATLSTSLKADDHSSPARQSQSAASPSPQRVGAPQGALQAEEVGVAPPAPLPEPQPTLEPLLTDITRCLHGVGITANVLSKRFVGLVDASSQYLNDVGEACGNHCDVLLQTSSFLEFQANEVSKSAMVMLDHMQNFNRDMLRAKEILRDIQMAKQELIGLETVLTKMEVERGIAVKKK